MFEIIVIALMVGTFIMARNRGINIFCSILAALFAPITTIVLIFIPVKK